MLSFLIVSSLSYCFRIDAPTDQNTYIFYYEYVYGGTQQKGALKGDFKLEVDADAPLKVYVKSSECAYEFVTSYTPASSCDSTPEKLTFDMIPEKCKVSGGGGDDSRCSADGKTFSITKDQTTIQSRIVDKCPNAEKLVINAKQVTLQGDAFKGSNLKTVEATGNQITVQGNVFQDCKSLTTVTVVGDQFSVQGTIFRDCINLESVTITGNQATIQGDGIFCGCSKMTNDKIHINGEQTTVSGDVFKCPKDDGGSSSGKDSDSGLSARILGNFEIKSAFLGTTPNIIVNLNFFYSFMKTIRKSLGRVVPSPEIVHSAIWVGEANPTDESMGAVFMYGRYFNKNNNQAFLWNDGAKGYALSFKDFKLKFNAANPMKLNIKKNIKLLDFIDTIKSNGNWEVKDYNWPTNNCQHFTAKLINILGAKRASPSNDDWVDVPKLVLDSLKSNEEN